MLPICESLDLYSLLSSSAFKYMSPGLVVAKLTVLLQRSVGARVAIVLLENAAASSRHLLFAVQASCTVQQIWHKPMERKRCVCSVCNTFQYLHAV